MRKLLQLSLLCICALFLFGCIKANDTPLSSDGAVSSTAINAPEPDPIPEPEEGTMITVRYCVNSSLAGSLKGELEQTVRYGITSTTRVAVHVNPGYRFVGWSDGSQNLIRGSECPRADTVYTAIFEYAPLELPTLHLTTETRRDVPSKTKYIDGTITISNCLEEYAIGGLEMEIRGRGNSSWNMEKKSYRINLSEKQNLLGIGEGAAKSWVLLACHADQALIRNHITLSYARKLDGLAFIPASTGVELYLNGEYRGVYFLCEQNEVNRYRINISENPESIRTGYFIELSNYAVDPQFTAGGRRYEIKNDLSTSDTLRAQQIAYIQTVVERCWTAVMREDKQLICALIDIPSVVDAYIVEELFKNKDDGWDSFYLHYDASVEGEVLHFGPLWDFDLSGGNTDSGAETYDGLWAGVSECVTDNQWFIKLMEQEWFRDLVRERWNELKPKTDKIPQQILSEAKTNFNSYSRNFEKWQIFGEWINQQPPEILALKTYTEHYNYYAKWMRNRIAWLDNYFNNTTE